MRLSVLSSVHTTAIPTASSSIWTKRCGRFGSSILPSGSKPMCVMKEARMAGGCTRARPAYRRTSALSLQGRVRALSCSTSREVANPVNPIGSTLLRIRTQIGSLPVPLAGSALSTHKNSDFDPSSLLEFSRCLRIRTQRVTSTHA